MKGCARYYSSESCQSAEIERMKLIKSEPSRQYNYTDIGYEVIPLPLLIRREIKSYFHANVEYNQVEDWNGQIPEGIFPKKFETNHWSRPTHVIPLTDDFISKIIVNQVQGFLERWVQSPISLAQTPVWRIYPEGSLIAPHVELLPSVVTMIYQIDYDDDEEELEQINERWKLELVDHHGLKHVLTPMRGDLLIYEVSTN